VHWLPLVVSFAAAAAITPTTVRSLARQGMVRENYRGAAVAFPAGIAIIASALVALIVLALSGGPRIAHVTVTGEIRRALELPDAEVTVVRIKRARFVDDAPYTFTVNLLPLAVGERLEAELLRRMPIVRVLEDVLQIDIGGASEVFQAAAADTEIAHWLEVPVLSPVMHVRRSLYDAAGRPLQIASSYYRADKVEYSVQLVRARNNGRGSWTEQGKTDGVGQVLKI